MNKIAPNLFLGGVSAAFDEKTYRDYKVTHVLSIMRRQTYFVRKMTETRKRFDVSHRLVNVKDDPRAFLMKYWPRCFDFIDSARENGGVVLVHCMAGVSRSAATVAAYLLYKNQFSSVNEALRHVQSKRRDVNPNPGFVRQLEFFYAMGCSIPQELTRAMKRRERKAFEVNDFAAAGENEDLLLDDDDEGRNIVLRVVTNVLFCLIFAHFACSISNLYTTQLYIDLATGNETRDQYVGLAVFFGSLPLSLFQSSPSTHEHCHIHFIYFQIRQSTARYVISISTQRNGCVLDSSRKDLRCSVMDYWCKTHLLLITNGKMYRGSRMCVHLALSFHGSCTDWYVEEEEQHRIEYSLCLHFFLTLKPNSISLSLSLSRYDLTSIWWSRGMHVVQSSR